MNFRPWLQSSVFEWEWGKPIRFGLAFILKRLNHGAVRIRKQIRTLANTVRMVFGVSMIYGDIWIRGYSFNRKYLSEASYLPWAMWTIHRIHSVFAWSGAVWTGTAFRLQIRRQTNTEHYERSLRHRDTGEYKHAFPQTTASLR